MTTFNHGKITLHPQPDFLQPAITQPESDEHKEGFGTVYDQLERDEFEQRDLL